MKIEICHGKSCSERFCKYINTRLENDIDKFQLKNIELIDAKCMGMCKKGPNIKVNGEVHNYMNPAKAAEAFKPKPKKKKK
ncbi:MAG: (2Fe-2S) ferredoxin domain-containing protein [Candidatus Gracilibacteria bacterium]|nr:(2Fe-2S) ferredoxin domain-containing protein [Candidatus Gracilibacteria bacterium]